MLNWLSLTCLFKLGKFIVFFGLLGVFVLLEVFIHLKADVSGFGGGAKKNSSIWLNGVWWTANGCPITTDIVGTSSFCNNIN
jgi:hypothetical protein